SVRKWTRIGICWGDARTPFHETYPPRAQGRGFCLPLPRARGEFLYNSAAPVGLVASLDAGVYSRRLVLRGRSRRGRRPPGAFPRRECVAHQTRPFIGINPDLVPAGKTTGARLSLGVGYADAVVAAGGVPVILPPLGKDVDLDPFLDRLDGFVLSGGLDLDPRRQGQP